MSLFRANIFDDQIPGAAFNFFTATLRKLFSNDGGRWKVIIAK